MKQIKLKLKHLRRNCGIPYIQQYLNNLGIEKTDSFINQPSNSDEADPFSLENMREAVKLAYAMCLNNSKIYVIVDADTDGFTSSAILINYLRTRFPNISITYGLHPGKEHGIVIEDVPEGTQLVFIPDAGSNQFQEQNELFQRGIKTIILDHHEISDLKAAQWSPSIIVNNQISTLFPNKSLSGAGVVYKFIEAMDKTYFPNSLIYQNYGDLAAIGIIADAMDMTTLDNNYIAFWGLSHIHNKFISQLAIKQSRGIKDPSHLTKMDVAFYIAPVINGVIRSGSKEDKETIFHAMIHNECEEVFPHEYRGTTTNENLWERAVRLAMNAKSRQDASKKKSFTWLCEKVHEEGWDKHNIIIVPLDERDSAKVSPNITGLIAMELVREFNKPALVLRKTEVNGTMMYAGSGRNGSFYKLPNLKDEINAAGGKGEGHQGAFGAFVGLNAVDKIRNYFDTKFDSSIFQDNVYEVDYWFHTGESIDLNMLMEMASYDDLWGTALPQPTFALDINYTSDDLKVMGAKSDSIKIRHDGIDFVAFKCPDLINQLRTQSEGHITVIGHPSINEWNGRRSVQIIIQDVNVFDESDSVVSARDLI